jgi:uncharacterized protein (TIGR02001 family)
MKTLQKSALALATSSLLATAAYAQTAPAAPEASPITANVTITNDYRYRGISQSNLMPAIQGGFDYAHESGLYVGNWNSSISWISDTHPGSSAPIEMDFYAGIKKELIGEGFVSDLGVLQYYYPVSGGTAFKPNPNTTEVYAAQNFTFGPATGFVKFSYATTPLFGISNSNGSYYPDLTVNYDTGISGLSLNAHIGYQYVAGKVSGISNNSTLSFTDWKLGLTKDFGGGLSGSVAYIDTSAKKAAYSYNNKNMGGATGLFSLTKAF